MAKSSFLSFAPTTSSSAKEIVVRKNAKNLTNPSDEHYYTQQEIESHSITPDTFRDRTLHQFKYLSEDFTWFIDEYEHGQSAVKRYGINAAKIDLKKVKPDQIIKDPTISKDPSKTALHLYLPKDKDPYTQLDTMSKASDASKIENRAKEVVHRRFGNPFNKKSH